MRIRDFELCCSLYQINKKYILPHEICIYIISICREIEVPILIERYREFHYKRFLNPFYGIPTEWVSLRRSLNKILGDDFRRHLEKQFRVNSHVLQLCQYKTHIIVYHNNHQIIRRNRLTIHRHLLKHVNKYKYIENINYFIKIYEQFEKMLIKLM